MPESLYAPAVIIAVLAAAWSLWRQIATWKRGWETYTQDVIVLEAKPYTELRAEALHRFVCPLHGPDADSGLWEDEIAPYYDVALGLAAQPVALGTRNWTYDVRKGEPLTRRAWVGRCAKLSLTRRYFTTEIKDWFLCYPQSSEHYREVD